jgi:hypothetical protein
MNTINELIVAYKLFEREITYDDLLNVELDSTYLISTYALNKYLEYIPIRINEYIPIRINKDYKCFLSKQPENRIYKSIKPNLFGTASFINLLINIKAKDYKYDHTSNYRGSFTMC